VLSPKSTITVRPNVLDGDENFDLIAGGRYLLTMHQDRSQLKLWDLGLPGKGLESQALVAEEDVSYGWDNIEVQAFGERTRVAVAVRFDQKVSL